MLSKLPNWAIAVALLAPAALLILSAIVPWTMGFTVEARTEVLAFVSAGERMPRWHLRGARLLVDEDRELRGPVQLELSRHVRVRIRRVGGQSTIIEIEGSQQSVASGRLVRLFDESDRVVGEAKSSLVIELDGDAPATTTLPIAGQIIVGDVVFSQTVSTSPILREATISFLAETIFGSDRFQAGSARINAGERFYVSGGGAGPVSTARGFVRVDAAPGLFAVYHAVGRYGHVTRYGSAGYTIRASLWSRVSTDPFLRALAAVYAPIFLILLQALVARMTGRDIA